MRLSLAVTNFDWPAQYRLGPTLARLAADAEAAGFTGLWTMDHFLQTPMNGRPDGPCPEAYALLAYLAATTRTLRLGTLVSGVVHRHPAVLVKTVTTIDVLSEGRAVLGIGAAWYEREQRAMGIPVLPLRERLDRLEEALQIAHRMWSGDETPFHGRYHRLEWPVNRPPAVRRPPILVGGQGERRTLRLVARYADACNLYEPMHPTMRTRLVRNLPPEHPMRRGGPGADPAAAIRHKLEVLAQRCAEVGRPFADIERTTLGGLSLSRRPGPESVGVAEAVERYAWLASLGIDHAVVEPPELWREGTLELWAEVAAGVRDAVPADRTAPVPA